MVALVAVLARLCIMSFLFETVVTQRMPTVIIVGTGMSGISTAKTLSDADILILEATNRIGGRIQKTNFARLSVEMGAIWVEGVNGKEVNLIWAMVNDLELKTFPSDYKNLTSNTYKQDVPSTQLETTIDYYNYDFEFAERPR
ncbi:sarcosine oxidasee (formaldehyde-forming) [Ranunculus cassubicifolius]